MSFTLLLPIFLLAGLGALLVQLPWLKPGWHAGATELTAKFLVPCLLFVSAWRTGMPASMSWKVLCAFYLPLGLLFLAARLLAAGRGGGAAAALAATYSNTVFVGVPVLVQVLGEGSLQFAYPVIAFHSLFCFTLYHLSEDRAPSGWLGPLLNTLKNPIVAALLLGLALNLARVGLPQPLLRALGMLGAAALPCALLSLGASVATLKPGRWAATGAIVLAKLLLLPLGVALLSVFVFHLPMAAAMVLIVLASCPVGINAAFVVKPAGDGTQLVHSAILLSSLLCAATMPAWLWALRHF
ncbi:AEC family transporter [Massilia norwichensis]|uniref:AEC family transporter n=1 Tax=Massilia norwichensis TaxID=1442366 RepID=A0ABT2A1S4_9BURK|nr:AEC family transporter [Massilia norwichensis]MCS0587805.1 AEC family transporter [Massilia norwichensis]